MTVIGSGPSHINRRNPSPAKLAADPDYLLFDMLPEDQCRFVGVTRDTYRLSAFLDERIVPVPTAVYRCSFNKVKILIPQITCPDLIVLHTGFCASTLLTKCLQSASLQVLREPKVLGTVAAALRGGAAYSLDAKNKLPATMSLLNKRYPEKRRLIIKLSNFTNNLIPEILRFNKIQKMVLVYGELKDFLVSIFKHQEEAKMSLDKFLLAFLIDCKMHENEIKKIMSGTLMQRAVWVWYLQIKYIMNINNAFFPAIRIISKAQFLEQPDKTIKKINEFINEPDIDLAQEAAIQEMMGKNSKKSEISSTETIEASRSILAANKKYINEALVWAENEFEIDIDRRMKKTIAQLV